MSLASLKLDDQGTEVLSVTLDGDWKLGLTVPATTELQSTITVKSYSKVQLVAGSLLTWDSRLIAVLLALHRTCAASDCQLDRSGMPEEIRRLLALATEVEPNKSPPEQPKKRWQKLAQWFSAFIDFLRFIGELSFAVTRLFTGRSSARTADSLSFFYQVGPSALGIVTLISVLTGMILAYLGTVQLRQFGAEVYVSNLVAVGMVREMGALMTAVIMAGRTGAAYAAQLGTMQVNDEIDALTTLGIKPVDYLVMPRILALIAAMPLLCIYSDALGILGGGLVATGMDITWRMYFYQLIGAISLLDISTGIFKSLVFGLLIAIAGCHAGMRCGRSSAAVGLATTKAVVTAIVYLVVADAGLNILYYQLGI